jgi:hypothetical protein
MECCGSVQTKKVAVGMKPSYFTEEDMKEESESDSSDEESETDSENEANPSLKVLLLSKPHFHQNVLAHIPVGSF